MEKNKKSGFRTLLMSVLLSAPGPLVLGLGLTVAAPPSSQTLPGGRRSCWP